MRVTIFLFILVTRHNSCYSFAAVKVPTITRDPKTSASENRMVVSIDSKEAGNSGHQATVGGRNDEGNERCLQQSKNGGDEVISSKKLVATPREYGGDDDSLPYRSGIPTLRSSSHRVKSKRRKHDPNPRDQNGRETKTTWLPEAVIAEDIFQYDVEKFGLGKAIVSFLQRCDPDIVGNFITTEDDSRFTNGPSYRLEDFRVPVPSVWRSVNGGRCETAQKHLSDCFAADDEFMTLFDEFVREVALKYLKKRLVSAGAISPDDVTTFYYQRPPTLRLQPGPAWAKVKPHHDAEYGHQNGELNFWIPLTDRLLTGVDLWCETKYQAGDYHPIPAGVGEVISFHGSSCRHYVNANETPNTRVSLDFRVGVQGFFDPYWMMKGTTDDHGRQEVCL